MIIYGGQGNVQLKHLHQMVKTDKGRELLLSLQKSDEESYQLIQDILDKKVALEDIHAAMLSNFLYNEWVTDKEKIEPGTIFSAHSAGIFNVLLTSGSADFKRIVYFIKKRAQLVEKLNCSEELWLLLTEDLGQFYQDVLEKCSEKMKLAIVTDESSGVLAMAEESVVFLEETAYLEERFYKLKKLGVSAPYHTGFLDQSFEEYEKLVQELQIVQNDSYQYIFHCEDLSDELLYQWNNVFNWKGLKERILTQESEIFDLSPNKFISKQLLKMKKKKRGSV